MDYVRLESKIHSLLEELLDELEYTAFLQNAYSIEQNKIIKLGPVSEKQIADSLPHIKRAIKVSERLEKVCKLFKRKYGSTDDIGKILEGLQDVYALREFATEPLAYINPEP